MQTDFNLKAKFNYFKVPVTFVFYDTQSIGARQKKIFDGFGARQDSLVPDMLQKIFEFYKTSFPDYRLGGEISVHVSEEELETFLPTPTTPEKLSHFITPTQVFVPEEKNCEEVTFSILFECTWDEEHGMGVVVKDWKVVEAKPGVDIY